MMLFRVVIKLFFLDVRNYASNAKHWWKIDLETEECFMKLLNRLSSAKFVKKKKITKTLGRDFEIVIREVQLF